VSAAVTALEYAYTDAHLFETIVQIREDELDGAGTLKSSITSAVKLHPTNRPLVHSPIASSSSSLFGIRLSSKWKQLDAHQKQKSLVYLVLPLLAPRRCVPSFASLKCMPRASTSRAYI
jgi:hypothetical protein